MKKKKKIKSRDVCIESSATYMQHRYIVNKKNKRKYIGSHVDFMNQRKPVEHFLLNQVSTDFSI